MGEVRRKRRLIKIEMLKSLIFKLCVFGSEG